MYDRQQELLFQMVSKINEARTYNIISLSISIIWLIEFIVTFFYTHDYSYFYWVIFIFCVIGWYHMKMKFNACIVEYDELKKEYEDLLK